MNIWSRVQAERPEKQGQMKASSKGRSLQSLADGGEEVEIRGPLKIRQNDFKMVEALVKIKGRKGRGLWRMKMDEI